LQWIVWLLAFAGVVAVLRVYLTVRRLSQRRGQDWDERLVKNLRAQGGELFRPLEVDFFFDLPDQGACERLDALLSAREFAVDFHRVDQEIGDRYTLHARKAIRISVSEMQEQTREFRELAAQHGGRYDGWAAAGMMRPSGR
jgi:regulator of ribonuclease activity B